jgi:hypothetical protein
MDEFPLARWRPSLTGLHTKDPLLRQKFVGTSVRSIFSPFQAILSTFCFSLKNQPPGGMGGPQILSTPILNFFDLKALAKFRNLTITPSMIKVMAAKERREKRH